MGAARAEGSGISWGRDLADRRAAAIDAVRPIVTDIVYWASIDGEGEPLALDEDRLGELDEAWVPVLTSDGPGVLVWNESD